VGGAGHSDGSFDGGAQAIDVVATTPDAGDAALCRAGGYAYADPVHERRRRRRNICCGWTGLHAPRARSGAAVGAALAATFTAALSRREARRRAGKTPLERGPSCTPVELAAERRAGLAVFRGRKGRAIDVRVAQHSRGGDGRMAPDVGDERDERVDRGSGNGSRPSPLFTSSIPIERWFQPVWPPLLAHPPRPARCDRSRSGC
jgi:hypothetical protein